MVVVVEVVVVAVAVPGSRRVCSLTQFPVFVAVNPWLETGLLS